VTLYAETHGEGPPVLLLHGFGASTYSWRHIVNRLAKDNTLILLDLKGFGRSSKPPDGAYSIYDQAAAVRHVIRNRDLRRLTLVGHSFGGGVALAVATDLINEGTKRLAGLILIDSPAYRQRLPLFIAALRTPVLGSLAVHLLPPETQVRSILELAYFDKTKIPPEAVSAYAAPMREPGARESLIATAKQIVPEDVDVFVKNYEKITVPVLILWGRHDSIVPIEIGQRLHRALPHSEFIIIDNAGHIPHEEVPEDTVPHLASFLARVYGR
jgi:pimeloyl-ACP methyl ester carboxylesterase